MDPVSSENLEERFDSVEKEPVPKESTLAAKVASPFFAVIDYFYGVNPVLGRREFGYLPTWVEKAMGTAMYPGMVFTQGGKMPHHFELPKVQEIMGKLKAHARRDLPYEVQIINKDVVNAWCLPGGKMAIYRRILERIDYYVHNREAMGLKGYTHPETGQFISYDGVTKEDVVAALLGHEMTHADARHSARKLEWSFIVQVLIFSVSAYTQAKLDGWRHDLKGRAAQQHLTNNERQEIEEEKKTLKSYQTIHNFAFNWLVKIGVELYFLMGSRHHELEADKYGTRLAKEAGYNPAGALLLQEILKSESHGLYDYLPTWYQKLQGLWCSHPSADERQGALFTDVRDWTQRGV